MKFAGILLNVFILKSLHVFIPLPSFQLPFHPGFPFVLLVFCYLESPVLIYLLPPFNILSCCKDLHRHLLPLHLYTLPQGKDQLKTNMIQNKAVDICSWQEIKIDYAGDHSRD